MVIQAPLPSPDLYNQIYDLFVLFDPDFFLSRYVMFSILLSIFIYTAAGLFFAWVECSHVSMPFVITGSKKVSSYISQYPTRTIAQSTYTLHP